MGSAAINIDIIFNAVNKTTSAMNAVNKGFTGMVGNMWKVNQGVEAFDKLNQAVEGISAPGKGFQYGMAEMESITGITGTELTKLGKIARKTGIDSGYGAKGSIEAYKLLASNIDVAKEGMEGLNSVHKNTLTLAATSKELGLSGAATALAGTLNQYNLAASESGRVMNVLAAGAKYGAAEVPDLTQSFKVAGAAAAAAGLSVEQTGGAIEVLSKMNIKGSEAGTALRNVLLKMQTELGFDFKVTKLSDALATLEGKEGDAAYMAKIFGAENIAAAQFLVKNSGAVEQMTKDMTGTSVATEQAAIMQKTFTHRLDVMRARMDDALISFFNMNKGMIQTVQVGGEAVKTVTALAPVGNLIGMGFKGAYSGIMNTAKAGRLMSAALAAGKLGTYSDLIARYGAAGKVAAVGLKISTVAQGAWNAITGFTTTTMVPLIASTWAWTTALLANPITWVVVGVGALIAGLALAWKHFDGFRGAVVGAWEGIKQFGVILWQSIITPLKQIIGGIGAVGKAIGLMFKGKFGEAAATAKEGFASIAEGAVKASPIGVAVQVASRRQEIVDKAAAGYQKGKAIDTGNFLSFGKKKKETGEGKQESGNIGRNFAASLPKQGLSGADPFAMNMPGMGMPDFPEMEIPSMPGITVPGDLAMSAPSFPSMEIPGQINATAPKVPGINIAGTIDAKQPTMKVVKAPGMVTGMTMPQPVGVTVPGDLSMSAPSVPSMAIPGQINAAAPKVPEINIAGTIDAKQPTMNAVKAPGIVTGMTMPQPAGVTVPGDLAMNAPSVPSMAIPGQINAASPKVPGINIAGTIDAKQPTMKVVKAPGMVTGMTMPQPAGVTVPGDLSMSAPSVPSMAIPGQINAAAPKVPGINIPGTIDAKQPTVNAVKAPGMVAGMTMPQPAGVTVPGELAMSAPSVPSMAIPGQINAATPKVPGINIPGNLQVSPAMKPDAMTIPGTIDAAQPEAKPMDIPGNVILNVQKIQALNFLGALSFAPPKKIDEKQATKATGGIVDLTKNITNNIQKNETYNSTASQTKNDSSAKIEVTYSPVINISSNMDAKATDDLMKMLADNKDELMKLINEEMRRNDRLRYAG